MSVWKNKWWRGGCKKVSKNVGKRTLLSTFNIFWTAKQHVVYLACFIGIASIFFGQWLLTISAAEKEKLLQPLRDIDEAVDEVIDGLNYLTQQVPKDVIVWVNGTIFTLDKSISTFVGNAAKEVSASINVVSAGIAQSSNDIVRWAKQRVGDTSAQVYVIIPQITIPSPNISGWAPPLQIPDLSAAKIPARDFSVERELTPFIDKVFEIPITLGNYLISIGTVLLIYVAVRFFWALITPWTPKLACPGCGCCMTCLKMTTKAISNTIQELLKPWIHIPLIIGVVMSVVIGILLFAAIDKVDEQVRIPLKEADKAILMVVNQVNNFTITVPEDVRSFVNNAADDIELRLYVTATYALQSIQTQFTGLLYSGVQVPFTQAMAALGLPPVNIVSGFSFDSISFVIPRDFIPAVPVIDVSSLLIPESVASVESALSPWIDDRIREFRQVATVMLIIFLVVGGLPAAALLYVFCKAYIPEAVKKFFLDPTWDDDDDVAQTANQTELVEADPSQYNQYPQ